LSRAICTARRLCSPENDILTDHHPNHASSLPIPQSIHASALRCKSQNTRTLGPGFHTLLAGDSTREGGGCGKGKAPISISQ
jgi:hypothetical protein